MTELYRTAVKTRIEQAKSDLINNFENMKDDLDDIMEMHHSNGYLGWEFMRDPFLWREECKPVLMDIEKKVNDRGYTLFLNSKYHTVSIMPPPEFGVGVKDCVVGYGNDQQFIHYTLDDNNLDKMKKLREDAIVWQQSINDRLQLIEKKLQTMNGSK